MIADILKKAPERLQNARRRLTNGPTWYSLMLTTTGNDMANRAECVTTPHGSHPTLSTAVTGLHRIIQNHRTPVLCGFSGPTDSTVGLGRCVVPVRGRG
jgi:hypothetical protein